jgi:hypothetical protein
MSTLQATDDPFSSTAAPPMTLFNLGRRVAKYGELAPSVYITAICITDIYITRKSAEVVSSGSRCRHWLLTPRNAHRIVLVSFMLAQKLLVDVALDSKSWAWMGGVDLDELNALERKFLTDLRFRLSIPPATYRNYVQALLLPVLPQTPLAELPKLPEEDEEMPLAELTARTADVGADGWFAGSEVAVAG